MDERSINVNVVENGRIKWNEEIRNEVLVRVEDESNILATENSWKL